MSEKRFIKVICTLPFTLFFLLTIHHSTNGQESNPYNLRITSDISDYHAQCLADSNNLIVDLALFIPGVILDIRYATEENFTGEVIYSEAKAYARLPVARALEQVQSVLVNQGIGLKIYDAYRPYSATLLFWNIIGDTLFVASPWNGSRHNRGCAVDVSLIDLISGEELRMPTPYDDFSEAASSVYPSLPAEILKNRNLLIEVMDRYGFMVMESEWWHFDFNGWEKYPLMDISFSDLGH
jgi:D-alanyl-D-alanine dipeptidase